MKNRSVNMKTSLNFGTLKESITKKATLEISRENNNDTLKSFSESLRRNSTIKKQYLVYKNFENVKPFNRERLAERFIAQNMRSLKGIEWRTLVEENKRLRKSLLGNPDESHVTASSKEKEQMYECINTLIESELNPNFSDFEREADHYGWLVDHLTREEEQMNEEIEERPKPSRFWKFITKNALNNFDKRHAGLSESERRMFKMFLASPEEKAAYINNLKKETIEDIDEKISGAKFKDDIEVLESFKQKLAKEVDEETLISEDYIFSCFELKQALEKL